MENPLVTVFTITRNRCDLLPRAMKSVLNQTYKNIEYIIIDGASTDDTELVVKNFKDERVRYIKLEQNETFGHCFNIAIRSANGKYLTELDDDDEYQLDKLEKQVSLFETLPEEYGMVYCWMTYYDNASGKQLKVHKTELRGNVVSEAIKTSNVSGTPTLLIRKKIFEKIGGYKEQEEIGTESDWELAARICKYYKVDYVPESLVNVYVNHTHTRMSDTGYYTEYAKKRVIFHEYFLNEFADVFRKHTRSMCPHFIRLAVFSWQSKQYAKSLKYAAKYVKYRLFGTK